MLSKDDLQRIGAAASMLLPTPVNEVIVELVDSHLEAYGAVGDEQARTGFVFLRQQISQEVAWLRANKDRFDPKMYEEMEARWVMLATAGLDKGL